MKKFYDVVVVGGGASGLACAVSLAESGKSVCVLEKASKVGKKILQTGNGRCNLSNQNISEIYYNENFVKGIFQSVSKDDVILFLKEIGIETFADCEGRIYPISETAVSVVDALNLKLKSLNVDFFCEEEVVNVSKSDDNNYLIVKCLSEKYFYSGNVVLACGVLAVEKMLENFSFREKKNVLVGLKCQNYDKDLFGIRQNANVSIPFLNFYEKGQVQFKEDGISGIVVFNASFEIARLFDFPIEIFIDLLPEYTYEQVFDMIWFRTKNAKHLLLSDCLIGILPFNLSKVILKRAFLNDKKSIENLSQSQIKNIVVMIKNFSLVAISTLQQPQVLAGGILKSDIFNLELKKMKNVFVCGEASGVYGKCGGFNLHYAFASGLFVAKQIKKQENNNFKLKQIK